MSRISGLGLIVVAAASACYGNNYDDAPPPIPDQGGFFPETKSRDYGETIRAERNPPPISGGTLLVSADGLRAVAADSDRDQVYVVDLAGKKLTHKIKLQLDDEPGRVVEDGKGRVHVVLRHGGAIVSIDPIAGAILSRRSVCKLPRGIAWDAEVDKLHVTCLTGELYTMPTEGDAPPTIRKIGDDLRDIVVNQGQLIVSRFRSTDTLVVDRAGKPIAHTRLHPIALSSGMPTPSIFDPAVAWRMRAMPKRNAVAIVHQRGGATSVSTSAGGYAQKQACGSSIVHSAVSIVTSTGEVQESPPIPGSVLPVDFAISDDETQVAIVNAGNGGQGSEFGGEPTVQVFPMSVMLPPGSATGTGPSGGKPIPIDCLSMLPFTPPAANAIAVAFDKRNNVLTQSREPAALFIGSTPIALDALSVADTGHQIFHLSASVGGGVACASCHPEGGEDGRTWAFQGFGRRRTQTLRGGILQTAPFHWAGDEADISALMNDVFAKRMGGGTLRADRIAALSTWLDKVPASPRLAPVNSAAADRGKALFEGSADCSSCHNGHLFTNHKTVDVGTGAPFQVPVLAGIRFRAPFMHDGCAATLLDRFTDECGGGDKHGKTSHLTNGQLADLVEYLETL